MSQSNVGNAQVYEAGDQRNPPDSEKEENQSTPYEEGQTNAHDANDSSKPLLASASISCYTDQAT